MEPSYIPLAILLSIYVMIEVTILLATSYKLFCDPSTKKICTLFRYLTVFFIISATLCSICDIIHCLINETYQVPMGYDESWSPFVISLEIIGDIFYFLTTLILYSLFIGRLYITFKGSYYQLSKGTLIILSIIIIVIISSALLYAVLIILQLYQSPLGKTLASYSFGIWVISDMIINITLLILFNKKLKAIIASHSENNLDEHLMELRNTKTEHDDDHDDDNCEFNLDSVQLKFINVMTRFSLLSGIVIVLYQSTLIWTCSTFIFFTSYSWPWSFSYGVRDTQLLLCIICIVLNSDVNDNKYQKICNKLHDKLYNCYVKDTQQNIRRMTLDHEQRYHVMQIQT